jgi:hypothetical protein
MYPSVNRKYYLKEVSTLSEYVLDESLKECILVDNGELEVIINNSKKETTPTEKIVETVITERVEERVEEKVIEKIMEKPVIIENVKVLPRTGM